MLSYINAFKSFLQTPPFLPVLFPLPPPPPLDVQRSGPESQDSSPLLPSFSPLHCGAMVRRAGSDLQAHSWLPGQWPTRPGGSFLLEEAAQGRGPLFPPPKHS